MRAMDNKDKKLYMIGNAHLDPVWLWQWQEGFQETKATFRSALDRMKEYPDFVFTNSSAANYEWVENSDPDMFEEIRERVSEGRWIIVGGWWVQPDCNIPCGESYVRQGLYAQHYFFEKFGVTAHTGYNVDSFGHNGMLPQILKKCGMDSYVFMRPGRHEKALPNHTFLWKSKDGSEIPTFRLPFEYTWNNDMDIHVERCANEIKDSSPRIMCFYGVGNHGGGPTKANIEAIHEMNVNPAYPTLILASPENYFKDIKDSGVELPVVEGDLLHHASGCYSAHSEVKSLNRKAENRLMMAEKFSAMANVMTGQPYPLAQYSRAWKDVLFNQFHDIMAGSSIESAYTDAREAYSSSLHTASVHMNYAIQAMSWRVNIPMEEDMKPIVVFNPHGFEGKFEIEMESVTIKEGFILVDDEDRQVPFQLIQSEASSNGRCRICFIADLPSMGYRTYRIVRKDTSRTFENVSCTDTTIENSFFKLEFDEETGAIKSLVKKNDGAELFNGPAALPVVIEDKSDTWSHGIRQFNKVIGQFKASKVHCVENGPVKSVIRVISTYENSKVIQDFSVYAELDYILVKTAVDWREQFKMLKLRFPMNLNYLRGSFESPYGYTEREPDGEEYPMQSWMDFEGAVSKCKTPSLGLSIINDGKTSCDVNQKIVSMTVLRSPIYANHDPYVPKEDMQYTFQDQGIQRFHYVLYPHNGRWEEANTVRIAQSLNQKPVALFESYHAGKLAQKGSFLEISESNIAIGAMKMAEDGSGDIILRIYEIAAKHTDAVIKLPALNRELKVSFGACEIKTLRIPRTAEIAVKETDMLEWDV